MLQKLAFIVLGLFLSSSPVFSAGKITDTTNQSSAFLMSAGVTAGFPIGVSLKAGLTTDVDLEIATGVDAFRNFSENAAHAVFKFGIRSSAPALGWIINKTVIEPYFGIGAGSGMSLVSAGNGSLFAQGILGFRLRYDAPFYVDFDALSIITGPNVRNGWSYVPNASIHFEI